MTSSRAYTLAPVRYDLLLQPREPGTPFDLTRVDEALRARTVEERPDGTRVWNLGHGEVEVGTLREANVPVAVEVRVPFSDRPELLREALAEASTLAEGCGVAVHDPQLMRTVTTADEPAIEAQYLRTARWAGEMMGLPEAVAASFAPPKGGLSTETKVLLGLGAGGVVVWLVVEALLF